MRLLVITSCTGDKAIPPDFPVERKLTIEDFRDPDRLAERERELAAWRLPADQLYTGRQHTQLMAGVRRLRQRFGPEAVTINIVSAGYGLVPEDRPLVPYDATFATMGRSETRAWADYLGIPAAVRRAAADFPIVIFLLGGSYLLAARPPLTARPDQRFVFLAARHEESRLEGLRVTTVPAGAEEATAFGDGRMTVKGRMFDLFARGVVAHRTDLLAAVATDDSAASFLRAVREGMAS